MLKYPDGLYLPYLYIPLEVAPSFNLIARAVRLTFGSKRELEGTKDPIAEVRGAW